MEQDRARGDTTAVAVPPAEGYVTFDQRAETAGHVYRETPAAEGLVDADCSCRGWDLWDVSHALAHVSWCMHVSPSIIAVEDEGAGS